MRTICSWMRQQEKRPNTKALEQLAERAALAAGLPENLDVAVVFLPDDKMAELNWESLRHQGPTDVISFDLRTPGLDFPKTGDDEFEADVEVYVCPDVARREARKRGLPYSREVTLYMAHGLLHAAGEDDLVPEKKRRMRRREKQVLAALENNCNFERIFGS